MLLFLLMNLLEHFSFLQPLKSDHTSINPHLKHVVVVDSGSLALPLSLNYSLASNHLDVDLHLGRNLEVQTEFFVSF